ERLIPVPDTTFAPPPTTKDVGTPTAPAAKPTAPAAAPTLSTPAPSTAAPATQPTAEQPAAAPALAGPHQAAAARLREVLSGKTDRLMDRRNKAAGDAFDAARNYAPLWIDNGSVDARAKAVAAFLAKVDVDGLDPADYLVPDVKAGAETAALADAELKHTQAVVTYARHAQTGPVHYSRISGDLSFNLPAPEAAEGLGGLLPTPHMAL